MVTVTVPEPVLPPLLAVAVKVVVPAVVGVPDSTPEALRLRRGGRLPLELHEYVPVPPLATSCFDRAVPTVPDADWFCTTTGGTGGGSTVIAPACDALPPALSVTVKFGV